MIRFLCTCGRQLQAAIELAGRQALCPLCHKQQAIPFGDATEAAAARLPDPNHLPVLRPYSVRRPQPFDGVPVPLNRRARWSLGAGIISLSCSLFNGIARSELEGIGSVMCYCGLAGIPAIFLGYLSLWRIGRSRGRMRGRGFAAAGIVTGILGTLLTLFLALTPVHECACRPIGDSL